MTNEVAQRGDEILRRMPADQPIRGAEVGVWDGRLSECLLSHHTLLTLYMVDRWAQPAPNSRYAASGSEIAGKTQEDHSNAHRDALLRTIFAGPRARVMRGESVAVAAEVAGASLDFAFIDADHTFEGVAEDLEAWAPNVKPGGLLCGHDWEHPNKTWGVSRAVRAYMAEYSTGQLELGANRTWFVRVPECVL